MKLLPLSSPSPAPPGPSAGGRWLRLRRLLTINRVLMRHGLRHLRLMLSGRRRESRPERLRDLFEELGGTFIKFGQMLALQPDILSAESCSALLQLLDRVAPIDFEEVERILTEEHGKSASELFDSVERVPLATASVGQVHVAEIGGERVAVKVQRPTAEAEFLSDTSLMSAAATAIRVLRLRPLSWLVDPLTEFIGWTKEELDYRNEARYSERLRAFSRGSVTQYVPKVYRELTTRRTLVVELLEGATLLDYLRAREQGDELLERRLEARGFDRHRFAANVIDNFLGDVFRRGLYHADLHPANLIILDNSVVGYIDFGITGVMSSYSRTNLVLMTLALAQGDTEQLYRQFLKLSSYDASSDLEGFRRGLEGMAHVWYEEVRGERRLAVGFTRVSTDMLNLSREARVLPERDIIRYIRSSIAIDGLMGRFEPDFHVGMHLEQSCRRQLEWQSLTTSIDLENLASFSGSSARLLLGGLSRSREILERLVSGNFSVRLRDPRAASPDGTRAIQLGLLVVALSALMSLNEAPTLGWNLFTAQALVLLGGLLLLLPTLRRLA